VQRAAVHLQAVQKGAEAVARQEASEQAPYTSQGVFSLMPQRSSVHIEIHRARAEPAQPAISSIRQVAPSMVQSIEDRYVGAASAFHTVFRCSSTATINRQPV
jgi:hypothetical protein